MLGQTSQGPEFLHISDTSKFYETQGFRRDFFGDNDNANEEKDRLDGNNHYGVDDNAEDDDNVDEEEDDLDGDYGNADDDNTFYFK